jgi:SAM-dependent methyltransferase
MSKQYDQAYFDRWYRDPTLKDRAIGGHARLARKVALAVATAEYHLERPLRSVLDIGCGEGAWRAPLLKLRPGVHYLGFDNSGYAITRHGSRRNLHHARFGDFGHLRPCPPADLVVCSDVLHYLDVREIDRGLAGLVDLCGGVAFLETFTRADGIDGDTVGFKARPAKFYRERFARHGLSPLGSHLWLSPRLRDGLVALEMPCVS